MKVTNSFSPMNLIAFFFTAFTLLGSFVVQAAPTVQLTERDVYSPHITSPVAGDVWHSRKKVQVTWDTSDAPKQITNRIGFIQLGKANRATPVVLANGFDILNGKVSFEVPLVFSGDDYFITLFGDSGNVSSNFTIQGVTF